MRAKTLMFATVVTVLALLPAGLCLAEEESDFDTNHLGVFLGATDWEHSNNREFTAGLLYEHRFNRYIGVGALVEQGDVGNNTSKAAIALWVHPFADALLLVAPGYEFVDHEEEEMVRAGVGWDLKAGENFTITPNFNVDFFDDYEVWVYGLTFGFGF